MSEKEPSFIFERLIARVIPILAISSFFIVLVYAFLTVAQFEITPSDNVEFVQDIRAEVSEKGKENMISLDKAHVMDNEIQNWISMSVSESLTFNKDDLSEVVGNIKPYYTEEGFKQFEQYLLNSGIATSIRSGDFDMGVYIEEKPIFLNSSVIDGKFKWLYQMPLAISFFPKNAGNVAENADRFVNRKVTLRLQITRAVLDDDPDRLQIETWTVLGRK